MFFIFYKIELNVYVDNIQYQKNACEEVKSPVSGTNQDD
jgi:hypothetical protein